MGYETVRDTIEEHNLTWTEIDRVVVAPDTYDELQQFTPYLQMSDTSTTEFPAVRRTRQTDDEKIVYVTEDGRPVEVAID